MVRWRKRAESWPLERALKKGLTRAYLIGAAAAALAPAAAALRGGPAFRLDDGINRRGAGKL